MKKKITFYAVKLFILLLINVPLILLTMVVSTVLGMSSDVWGTSESGIRAFTAVTSLFGFLGLLIYTAFSVRKLKRADPRDVPWRFALKESVAPALFLLVYAVWATMDSITIFEGVGGYLFAPYLTLNAFGIPSFAAAAVYVLLYWLTVFLVRLRRDPAPACQV